VTASFGEWCGNPHGSERSGDKGRMVTRVAGTAFSPRSARVRHAAGISGSREDVPRRLERGWGRLPADPTSSDRALGQLEA
jgi:hypothetical protein